MFINILKNICFRGSLLTTTEDLLYLQSREDQMNVYIDLIGFWTDLELFDIFLELNNIKRLQTITFTNKENDELYVKNDMVDPLHTHEKSNNITYKKFQIKEKKEIETAPHTKKSHKEIYWVCIPKKEIKDEVSLVLHFKWESAGECYKVECDFNKLMRKQYIEINPFKIDKFKFECIQKYADKCHDHCINMINARNGTEDKKLTENLMNTKKLQQDLKVKIEEVKEDIQDYESRWACMKYFRRLYNGIKEIFWGYEDKLGDEPTDYKSLEKLITKLKTISEIPIPKKPVERVIMNENKSADKVTDSVDHNLIINIEKTNCDKPSDGNIFIPIACVSMVCVFICVLFVIIYQKYFKQCDRDKEEV